MYVLTGMRTRDKWSITIPVKVDGLELEVERVKDNAFEAIFSSTMVERVD